MRVLSFGRIDDVPAQLWETVAPEDFHFQRAFLRVMEVSDVEQARYRYLILLEGRAPVALAVLSSFVLKLDLLSTDRWVRAMRRWAPTLLDVPIVCCGIPASYGQQHLHVVHPDLVREAVHHVHWAMEEWAAERGSSLLLWKEWNPTEPAHAPVREHGYLPLPTLPDHRLVLGDTAGDIDAFLGELRSAYRRKYRTAAALLRDGGATHPTGALMLDESPFDPDRAAAFHDGYRQLMSRTPVRLETYPPAFFHALAASDLSIRELRLTNTRTGESLAALLYLSGSVLTFGLIAKERARYAEALYPTLLRCIVLCGVRDGVEEVRLGQTSGYAKCSAGAEPRRLEALIKMRTPWKHALLERFGPSLFPETRSPPLSVFRDARVAVERGVAVG